MDKRMMDYGPYGIALLNKQLTIFAANSTFCSILDYSEHDLINIPVDRILHPEFRTEFRTATDRLFTGLATFAEMQHQCVTNGGDHIPVRLTLDRLGAKQGTDETPTLSIVLSSISQENYNAEAYKQTQWFLQKTFDTIDQGITIYDSDFRLVAWNKRYENMKIFPLEFLQRGTCLVDAYEAIAETGVFGPGDPQRQAQEHIDALINRQVKPVEELRSMNERIIEIRRYLMPEGGLVAVFSDITDQRLAESQLRQSQKMEAVGQLTGGIAHDFNNILGIILGNLGLLESQKSYDEKVKKRIDTIKHTAQRAADLTRQLLAFSRSEAASPKTIDINRIIENQKNLIVHSLTPQVELDCQLAENLWLTEIDPGDFEDALINLALNARDAMEGRGRLTIETSNRTLDSSYCSINPNASPGDYVQLAVSDTGSGISKEQHDRIFEPFFTTKDKDKGTGLGLAMVFGFVKRSRGHIKLYSEPNIGSTFRIYLPRKTGQEQYNRDLDSQDQSIPGGGETLLIVEDETELAEIAQESLEMLGYRVLVAHNGAQAMDILDGDSKIDLLFSDVVMPGGMNGYELAEKAVEKYPKLKILLTSGYTEKAVAHNGQARFATNLLDKPYTQSEAAKRIRELLDD